MASKLFVALNTDIANKTAEYQNGIARVLSSKAWPAVMNDYLAAVTACTAEVGELAYPGSPWLANYLLRDIDRLSLCELHPQDAPILEAIFKRHKTVNVYKEDGFAKSVALLPTRQKRGLTVIDPSYEIKSDYDDVVDHIVALHKRFATGIYALWYPVVDSARVARLEARFKRVGLKNTELFELQTYSGGKPGMYASGMIVVNAPWTLKRDLELALPWLVETLGQDSEAKFRTVTVCGESVVR